MIAECVTAQRIRNVTVIRCYTGRQFGVTQCVLPTAGIVTWRLVGLNRNIWRTETM